MPQNPMVTNSFLDVMNCKTLMIPRKGLVAESNSLIMQMTVIDRNILGGPDEGHCQLHRLRKRRPDNLPIFREVSLASVPRP